LIDVVGQARIAQKSLRQFLQCVAIDDGVRSWPIVTVIDGPQWLRSNL
jgi:hypothetical protein